MSVPIHKPVPDPIRDLSGISRRTFMASNRDLSDISHHPVPDKIRDLFGMLRHAVMAVIQEALITLQPATPDLSLSLGPKLHTAVPHSMRDLCAKLPTEVPHLVQDLRTNPRVARPNLLRNLCRSERPPAALYHNCRTEAPDQGWGCA